MCTIIVTIRSVLWAVMTIAGSLMILVSLFTNRWVLLFNLFLPILFLLHRWLIGGFQVPSSANSFSSSFNSALDKFGDIASGRPIDDKVAVGIFLDCVKPEGSLVSVTEEITLYLLSFSQIFEGECIPRLDELVKQIKSEDDNVFPHAWKGGIGCFTLGLTIMILTVLLALLTPCCRYCMCCSAAQYLW